RQSEPRRAGSVPTRIEVLRRGNAETTGDFEEQPDVEDGCNWNAAAVGERHYRQRRRNRQRRWRPAERARKEPRPFLGEEDRQQRVAHEEDERVLQREKPKPSGGLGEEIRRQSGDASPGSRRRLRRTGQEGLVVGNATVHGTSQVSGRGDCSVKSLAIAYPGS